MNWICIFHLYIKYYDRSSKTLKGGLTSCLAAMELPGCAHMPQHGPKKAALAHTEPPFRHVLASAATPRRSSLNFTCNSPWISRSTRHDTGPVSTSAGLT